MIPIHYYKRGKFWHASFTLDGERSRITTRATRLPDAQYIATGKVKAILDERLAGARDVMLAELCSRWLNAARVEKKTWRDDQAHIVVILKHFGPKTMISQITTYDVQKFKTAMTERQSRGGKKFTLATVNRYLALLKAMFNKAAGWGIYSMQNPVRGVKLYHEEPHMRFFTIPELRRLLAAALRVSEKPDNEPERYIYPITATAIMTGMRLGEVLRLKWEDYREGVFVLRGTKGGGMTGKTRTVPAPPRLMALLRDLPSTAGIHIFPIRQEADVIKRPWAKVQRLAGLHGRFHNLRHSAATLMLQGGADVESVRAVLGHSSLSVTQAYVHATGESKRKAIEALPKLL